MDETSFTHTMSVFTKKQVFHQLVELELQLASLPADSDFDYSVCLRQLLEIVEQFNVAKKKKEPDQAAVPDSTNLFRLLSRNLALVLAKLPTKIYDVANNLLNHLALAASELPAIGRLAVVVLIDLFETFPQSLTSLVNFSVSQIYKIIKKEPGVSSDLVFLLSSLTKYSTRADIDEKLQAKLLKIVAKNIVSLPVQFDLPDSSAQVDNANINSISLKKAYILVLKNISVLSVTANYESLLALSASSSSAGAKMKPETIMSQQHSFQTALLASIEKPVAAGLGSYSKDVRIATVELLAHLFINFVPTGKFNAIEYLVDLYILPPLNTWNDQLTAQTETDVSESKKESPDPEDQVAVNASRAFYNVGIIETVVFYIQLEQFQNQDYLTSNVAAILEAILNKFGALTAAVNHIQNNSWVKTLEQWTKVVDYIVKEAGTTCHEILLNFLFNQFKWNSENAQQTATKEKKSSNLLSLGRSKTSSKVKNTGGLIAPYHNSYQNYLLLSIIQNLLPFGIDFNSFIQQDDKDAQPAAAPAKKEEDEEDVDDSKKVETTQDSYLVNLLFQLLINQNDYIRNYSLETLSKYANNNEVEVNSLVLTVFSSMNSEVSSLSEGKASDSSMSLDTNTSPMSAVRFMSYALALSTLIRKADSINLQNSTIVKVLSFCTQNLKHNNANTKVNSYKNSACWIILSSLVTLYNESEFVKLNSSQLLVFWKSLLTSQYVGSSLSKASEDGEKREIVDNLKLRNLSLMCLLNYLNTVELTPESLKQLQFLLTKAYNYLTYLESNFQVIGDITNFNASQFNEAPFNINGISNLVFSNYNANHKMDFKDVVISLILYGKKIILTSFAKLATLLKNDINSSMVVFLIKLFASPTLFSSENKEKTKNSKKTPTKIVDFDSSLVVLDEESTHSFGVTSKFTDFSYEVDNLSLQNNNGSKSTKNELFYVETFMKETQTHQEIDADNLELIRAWFDDLEESVFRSSSHSINYEPCTLLLHDYSSKQKYSPNLITSLVDLAIELFQLVFPYLTVKIQSSLLEQIRSALNSKAVSSSRYKALSVNISIALNGALLYTKSKKLTVDKEIITVMVDILKKIDTKNKSLIDINTESLGLACGFAEKKHASEYIDTLVSQIISDSNPFNRGKNLLAIAKIYKYTGIGASDVYNAAFQLINDPNPIVYFYSVSSLSILFNNNMTSTQWVPEILDRLYETYLTDDFGYDLTNKIFVNLKYKFSSVGVITKLIKIIVTILGPNLRGLPQETKSILTDLIVALRYEIGCGSIDDHIIVCSQVLALLQELIIFDPTLLDNGVSFYSSVLNTVTSKNLKLGLATPSPTSVNLEAIFPYNSSFGLYRLAYACLSELLKVHGRELLTKEDVQLAWVSLNTKPCNESKQLIVLWMEASPDMNWFATLNSLFKMSSKKLSGPFTDMNYSQKLLPLLQRQKKKNNAPIDFKDEEIENIVGDDGANADKNEPISWEFKLFIYDLLNNLLDLASKDTTLFTRLKSRIADLVKIAFLGSTSPINTIKLSGINLLNKVLGLYGDLEDPFYPGASILEQQQAQIISALVPCFNSGSNAEVIVDAINVSSKFINLPRMKFYSKQRILKTLIYFLEEISSNKFLRFGYLENMSEYSKKSIQVSILNCWALVKLNCTEDQDDAEPELVETLNKYSTLLISLWIISLKEYSTLRYTETASRELEIYSDYWVNFISVLSLELEENHKFVDEYLQGDASTFFFILFSQCIESLIRNKNITEVLKSLNSLVKNPELVEILFNNDIFGELVDLFDRLILIDDNTEIQCELVDIVGTIFRTYTTVHQDMTEGFDKLFELIRLCMLPLFNILPFLRTDYDAEDKATQLILRDADRGPHLVVLKSALSQLVEMVGKFPDVVKQDLYSCILYIFAKFYEYGNEMLISAILPFLKSVIRDSKQLGIDIVGPFYSIISQYFKIDKANNFSILTTMVLATVGEVSLDENQSQELCRALIEMIQEPDQVAMGIQCIKSLVQYSSKLASDLYVVKLLIKAVVQLIIESTDFDGKVGLEIVMLFARAEGHDEAKLRSVYKMAIPVILKISELGVVNHSYLNQKLLALIELNSTVFKETVNWLTPAQKAKTEELVKLSAHGTDPANQEQIQLKTFG